MIEIICKDDSEKKIQDKEEERVFLPKNIRQVGSPRGRHRIYLEDYVYTYLRSMAKNSEKCAAVFLGKSRVVKDIRYTFVSGVVGCSEAVFQWENISLDESFWDYIYKEQKEFFPEMEIVGWMLGTAGQAMELSPAVEAAHRKYFAGRDKILMLLDILEGEELFFVYEQGYLGKREGYYIYYEKNPGMQDYMIYKREEELRLEELRYSDSEKDADVESVKLSEDGNAGETAKLLENDIDEETGRFSESMHGRTGEVDVEMRQWQDAKPIPKEPKTQAEEALEAYRRMLLERQGMREERQNRRFLYTASSFFLVVLCVIGITTINNYRKMQEVEGVLNVLRYRGDESSSNEETDQADSSAASEEKRGLVVETVESQIEPLEESDSDKTEDESDDENQSNGEEDTDQAEDSDAKDNDTEDNDAENNDAEEASAVDQSGEKKYYTVQAGDTLNTICLSIYQSKDMVQKLKEVNGIEDGDKILVGQKLLLP